VSLIGGCEKCGRIKSKWGDRFVCVGCLEDDRDRYWSALEKIAIYTDSLFAVPRVRERVGSILKSCDLDLEALGARLLSSENLEDD
jgi:hypothetical protein